MRFLNFSLSFVVAKIFSGHAAELGVCCDVDSHHLTLTPAPSSPQAFLGEPLISKIVRTNFTFKEGFWSGIFLTLLSHPAKIFGNLCVRIWIISNNFFANPPWSTWVHLYAIIFKLTILQPFIANSLHVAK